MYETGLMHGRDGVQTIASHSSSFMHDTKWTCREIDRAASHPLRVSKSFPELDVATSSHQRRAVTPRKRPPLQPLRVWSGRQRQRAPDHGRPRRPGSLDGKQSSSATPLAGVSARVEINDSTDGEGDGSGLAKLIERVADLTAIADLDDVLLLTLDDFEGKRERAEDVSFAGAEFGPG